ncbi:MAG: hypothetical protein E6K84_03770 [Thaumarchaeota archaeon]|nr:MAG: hypothetical protein E6K84_03770 [Nitrososphaerota archaeon]
MLHWCSLSHPGLLEVAARSIPGSAHPYEDRILADDKVGLFAVADGVTHSSQGSGAVAAELALSLLREYFSGDLTAVAVDEGRLLVGNVGDSPAYLVRAKNMRGLIQEDKSPHGYITQVIGYPETIHVHSTSLQLKDQDMVIVASDGIEHVLRVSFVHQLLSMPEVSEVVDSIIQEAKARVTGYDDDKSVIVLRVVER